MSTLPDQAGTTSTKHALIVGFGLFLVVLVITLVSMSLNLPNAGIEVALS